MMEHEVDEPEPNADGVGRCWEELRAVCHEAGAGGCFEVCYTAWQVAEATLADAKAAAKHAVQVELRMKRPARGRRRRRRR